MSKVKDLTSTYINYYTEETGEISGIRLITLNGKDSKIFYKTDYNTYIPNAINYILGLLGHFGNKRSKPEAHVFVSNKLLTKNIGVSYSHASKVMDQIEDIFQLDISHDKGRGRSRTVKITKTFIDFMKVFSESQLEDYIITNNIDHVHRFALVQVYRYLGWGISPGQLSPELKAQRKSYMSDPDRKNFLHYAFTSKWKSETRIQFLVDHQEKLSESQQKQLHNLQEAHVPGERLHIYWFRLLIKLQQIVTWIIEKAKKTEPKTDTKTSVNNENTNQESSVAHTAATRAHQKKPEPITTTSEKLQFMGKIITSWNTRAERNNLPAVKRLTPSRHDSLLTLMEEYTQEEILKALHNIDYIHQGEDYDYKFTFTRFIQSETILYVLEYDTNGMKAIDVDIMTGIRNGIDTRRQLVTVPLFDSPHQLNTWLSNQI